MAAHILLVDDSLLARTSTERALAGLQDVQIHKAKNGVDALKVMEKESIDVVITDWEMPQMNGLELLGAIRQQYPAVPVIMQSSLPQETDALGQVRLKQAHRAGAFEVLSKPKRTEDGGQTASDLFAVKDTELLCRTVQRAIVSKMNQLQGGHHGH